MAIIRWNPLRDVTPWNLGEIDSEFSQVHKEIDQMFNRFLHGGTVADSQAVNLLPAVDIVEHENEYKVSLELPGVKKEDVKITLSNDVLTVKGEKKSEKESKGKNFHRSERNYGTFQRSFVLPTLVQNDKIEAAYDSGILTITLPKMEEAKPKEIEVKVK